MRNIIWLASYPKSGNTWFRVFLTNLLGEDDEPADINELVRTPIAAARELFDDVVGIEAADLSFDEVERLRPEAYRAIARMSPEPRFFKIHDAFTVLPDGRPLIPPDVTQGVIYIIRNPLDVTPSFAHHMGAPIDRAIRRMADEGFCLAASTKRLEIQMRQRLLSWSGHVRSWTRAEDLSVHVVRYEDMKDDALECFGRAVAFAGLTNTREEIREALEFSRIDELQRQEREEGFKERPLKSETFFRKGTPGAWRDELNDALKDDVIAAHGEVMREFGYLDEYGEPVF